MMYSGQGLTWTQQAVKPIRKRWRLFSTSYPGFLGMTMVTNIFLAVMGLMGGIISARMLGPTGRGELAAIQTIPTILASLAVLGIPDALVYFTARQPDRAGSMLSTSMLLALVFCVPFAIIGYLLIPDFLGSQSSNVILGARNYLWLLPINATVGMLVHPLRGRSDIPAWNLVRTFPTILWVVTLMVVILIGVTETAVITNWYLVGLLLLAIPTGFIVKKKVPGDFHPKKEYINSFVRYGIPVALSTLPLWLNTRLDQILLAAWFDPKILGLYVVAFSWSNAITPLTSVLPSVMLPYIAKIPGDELRYQTLAINIKLGLLSALSLSILIAILAPLFIPILYGNEFISIVPIAIILSLGAGFLAFNQVLEAGALSLGKPKLVLIAESFGLLITGLLLFLLLRPYGLMGAAIISLLSYSFISVFLVFVIRRITSLPVSGLLVLNRKELQFMLRVLRSWTNGSPPGGEQSFPKVSDLD